MPPTDLTPGPSSDDVEPTPQPSLSPFVGVPAEPPAPPRRRGRRMLKLSLVVLGTVALVGVPSAVALFMAMSHGSADQLVRVVPANADIYTTVLLDPSLDQKRNLASFLEHFPKLRTQQDIQKNIDSSISDSLKGSGLDYKRDVQPWLGSQIAGVIRFNGKADPGAVLLLRSTDDAAARTALEKTRTAPSSTGLEWSTQDHGGVTLTVGHYSGNSTARAVYAVFDHVVLLGSDTALADSVIDADQGRQANLGALQAYKDTLQHLPGDHLGVVYVNAASALATLKSVAGLDGANVPGYVSQALAGLEAYRTVGLAVSAQSDAMALDSAILTDPSRLTADQRSALAAKGRPAALSWMPQDSFGVIASNGAGGGSLPLAMAVIGGLSVVGHQTTSTFTNVSNGLTPSGPVGAGNAPVVGNGLVQPGSGLDTGNGLVQPGDLPPDLQAAPTPTMPPVPSEDPLNQLGLQDLASHLLPDAALGIGPGRDGLPVSAVAAVGVDDAAAVDDFLHKLPDNLGAQGQATWHDRQDGVVTIHSLDIGGTSLQPSYAMVDGFALIATDPTTLRSAIDAHTGRAAGVTASAAFRGSPAGSAAGGLLFLDFQALFSSVEQAMGGADRADFDQNVKPDVAPLRVLTITGSGDTQVQTSHVLLTVGG
jgi:hypothetical protein